VQPLMVKNCQCTTREILSKLSNLTIIKKNCFQGILFLPHLKEFEGMLSKNVCISFEILKISPPFK
jgi:hypothetical protein